MTPSLEGWPIKAKEAQSRLPQNVPKLPKLFPMKTVNAQ